MKFNYNFKNNIAINLIKLINRKTEMIYLLFLFILNSLFEGLTIVSIFPFLSVISDSESFYQIKFVNNILKILGIYSSNQLLLPITLIFVSFVLISFLIRMISLWSTSHIAAIIQIDLGKLLFKKSLYQTYLNHTKKDSSKIIASTTTYATSAGKVINAFLDIIAYSFISGFIIISLILINWRISTILIISLLVIYIIISTLIKNRLNKLGLLAAKAEKKSIEILQEGFGGFREILLNSTQQFHLDKFENNQKISKFNQAKQFVYSQFPRYFIESLALITLTVIIYLFTSNLKNQAFEILPILGTYALAFQKLLPLSQQIFNNWSIYNFRIPTVKILLEELNKKETLEIPSETTKSINFYNNIRLKDLSFKFQNDEQTFILKNINLLINKGEHIGILGSSGAGKSTLLNIIMGLLKPSKGNIFIDNINLHSKKDPNFIFKWRKSIAHVPQNIYLAPGTISQNITFGKPIEEINMKKIIQASEKANLLDFIDSTKYGFETLVGERGAQLSGGQRQRIGIARALYNNCNLLILDEATNALDNNTEKNILETINNLKGEMTLITVTHKKEKLEQFDRVIYLSNGQLIEKI